MKGHYEGSDEWPSRMRGHYHCLVESDYPEWEVIMSTQSSQTIKDEVIMSAQSSDDPGWEVIMSAQLSLNF